jgi:hypothetical protein
VTPTPTSTPTPTPTPTPSASCPDCSSGCEDPYYSQITITDTSLCDGNSCSDITGQELTQEGTDCQWTAADSPWNHELVCENGVWYYRVWNGEIGTGFLCAEWKDMQETTPDCPPVGSDSDGTWQATGEKCDGDFSVSEACGDCSTCDDPITSTISGVGGGDNCGGGACSDINSTTDVDSDGTCSWWAINFSTFHVHSCSCTDGVWEYTVEPYGGGSVCARWTALNVNGCPPSTGWEFDSSSSSCTSGTLTIS